MSCSQNELQQLVETQEELNETLTTDIESLISDINKANQMDDSSSKAKKINKISKEYNRILGEIRVLQGNITDIQICETSFPDLKSFTGLKQSKIKKHVSLKRYCSEGGDGCDTEFCKAYSKSKCPFDYKKYLVYLGVGVGVFVLLFVFIQMMKGGGRRGYYPPPY